jgi:hypothetical protein
MEYNENECLEQCEWQKFTKGKFYCKFYEVDLYSEKTIKIGDDKLVVYRCDKCKEEENISLTPDMEVLKRVKNNLDMLQDSFYTFKDDFDELLSNIYRIIKKQEKILEGDFEDD